MDSSGKPSILFVDDEPHVLDSYARTLRPQRDRWQMDFCACPLEAWDRLLKVPVDAVISDVRMPGISGFELMERVKNDPRTSNIPVVIVTGEGDKGLKRRALDMGAVDLLNKPVDRDDLLARLSSVLRLKASQDELQQQNELLEVKVRERTRELEASRVQIVWRLGKAAEFRDEETGNHVLRVAGYSRAVAERLGLPNEYIEDIYLAAPLHDIGKIGIPDQVLRKPGPLTDEEWQIMRSHCEIGAAILSEDAKGQRMLRHWGGLRSQLDSDLFHNPMLVMAREIALAHHEKWNGSGYPKGLKRESIPLSGRIVAICDVFDALRSKRPYKPAFDMDKALQILSDGAGSHFDPEVHAAFVDSLERIIELENEFGDQDSDSQKESADAALAVC